MGYDRVEQVWEGVSVDGLDGGFWEEGLPLCIKLQLEWSGHNLLWHLFQYGIAWTLNACWRWRVLHRWWWILKVWPRSPVRMGAAKTVSHGKCIILYLQIMSPRILLRSREKSPSRWMAVSYGMWHSPLTNFTANFETLSNAWQSQGRMLVLHIQD